MQYLNFKKAFEKPTSEDNSKIYQYIVAGQVYQSTRKIEQLEHLYQKPLLVNKVFDVSNLKIPANNQQVIYDDKVWIGETYYSARVLYNPQSTYFFKIDSQQYTVNNKEITIISPDIDPIILLGPILITNLAQNKIFCLHASAFIVKNKAFVLMGDSGTGKSTIANVIHNLQQCERLADDILPVKIDESSVVLLPQFPQLKLSQKCQYNGNNIVKETIFLFAKKSKTNTRIKPIDNFSAIKKLIKHSVATKLFAKRELQNHLEFCHNACSQAKSFDVEYQHSDKGLNKLIEGLNETF